MYRKASTTLAISVLVAGLIAGSSEAQGKPLLPPAGTIAFASDRDWGRVPSTQIDAVNADGTGFATLTNFPWWALTPSWSPDGSRIAFTGIRPEAAFKDGNAALDHAHRIGHAHAIYTMDANGTHVTQITSDEGGPGLPAWSPDGGTIAFLRWAPGCPVFPTCLTRHIALMNPDGSNVREITTGPDFDWRPTWSPDGMKLAFERDSNVTGQVAIYTVNRDGSGLKKILDVPCCPDPAFSPDGTTIAFWNSELPGLQTVNVKTKVVTTLALASSLGGGQTFERWASWSPDGGWLAVGSCCETSDGVDLYLVSADGTITLPVPNGEAASGPAWRPIG